MTPLADFRRAWTEGTTPRSCDLAGSAGCVSSHLGIDAGGFIYNCGRAIDASGMRFGHLEADGLEAALRHASRAELRERETRLEQAACRGCRYWRFCHGGCPYERHTDSEQSTQLTALCEDYRRLFAWFERHVGRPADPASNEALAGKPQQRQQPAHRSPRERVWSVPPHHAGQCEGGHLEIRTTDEHGLDGLSDLKLDARRVGLDLPASLYPRYRQARKAGLPYRARTVRLDRPAEELEASVLHELAAEEKPLWIGAAHGLNAVRTVTGRGVPVAIDDPRAWAPDRLREIATMFVGAPDLQVAIEPFRILFEHLVGESTGHRSIGGLDIAAAGAASLIGWYGEDSACHCFVTDSGQIARSRHHAEAGQFVGSIENAERLLFTSHRRYLTERMTGPCATCREYKFCRGFWQEPPVCEEHCAAWKKTCEGYRHIIRRIT